MGSSTQTNCAYSSHWKCAADRRRRRAECGRLHETGVPPAEKRDDGEEKRDDDEEEAEDGEEEEVEEEVEEAMEEGEEAMEDVEEAMEEVHVSPAEYSCSTRRDCCVEPS